MNELCFSYTSQPARVVFGAGRLATVADEVARLGLRRALVLCTPGQRQQAQRVCELLGSAAAGIFDGAVMHVPIEMVKGALEFASQAEADCVVAIGGGSTTGLAKALALHSPLKIIAIPTTYAGSEMTPIYGITESQIKTTGQDVRVLPSTVIYDPELTMTLSLELSIASGMNAIAHSAEGLYARDGNPIMSLLAGESIRAMAQGLRGLVNDVVDIDARSRCLYGAWLAGSVLGNVGMALHHKLCHVLGGTFNLPHAQTHTVLLPHAIAFNASAVPAAAAAICRALGVEHGRAGAALFELGQSLGAALSLKALGMNEAQLDQATDLCFAKPYWNPRPLAKPAIRQLLQDAFEGSRPTA